MGCGGHNLADLLGGSAALADIAGKPFTEKVVQRGMLRLGPPLCAFNQILVGTEGYFPRTPSVQVELT
jgi:hypothetical protein